MSAIRQRVSYKDPDVGAALRDLDDAITKASDGFIKREFTAVYSAPMYVGFDKEPWALMAANIREVNSLEAYVIKETALHFVWEAAQKRCRIAEIWDLTAGTNYRFKILAVM